MSGLRRMSDTKPSRTTLWSSAIRTLMGDFFGAAWPPGRSELAAVRVRVTAATGPDRRWDAVFLPFLRVGFFFDFTTPIRHCRAM